MNVVVWRRRIKRGTDFVLAAAGIVALMPVMLIVAGFVLRDVGRPVLFRQRRAGLNGESFELVKFRTMRNVTGPDGQMVSDAERLTRFGRFLRQTSLDELPELWNVLRGELSFVGPRPLLIDYLPLYSPKQQRRHEVRPGITGWAQVNGRNSLDWEAKFAHDVWYVDNWSIRLDARILATTVIRVVRRHGISGAGVETMTAFEGASACLCNPEVGSYIE